MLCSCQQGVAQKLLGTTLRHIWGYMSVMVHLIMTGLDNSKPTERLHIHSGPPGKISRDGGKWIIRNNHFFV